MSLAQSIRTIDCHVAGAPLRLVVEGFPPLEGASLADRQRFLTRRHDHLRRGLMSEPRGHSDMTGALLTTPVSPGAHLGLLFMHAGRYSSFCGHGLIGAVTVALERSLFVSSDRGQPLVVDTVAGPVQVRPDIVLGGGSPRVARVTYRSHPSFVVAGGVRAGSGEGDVPLDVVWANGLYALADGEALGIALVPDRLPILRSAALALLQEIDVRRFALVAPAGSPARLEGLVLLSQASSGADVRSVTIYADGSVDRSPSGSATAAVVTVLDAMGLVEGDRRIVHESLWGTRFTACIAGRADDGSRVSLEVDVEGAAWITGEHVFILDPDDPLRAGFG
jgi:proline racemase